ncbi:hypothetical protein PoB_004852400 [Plakobranchus ocellatus]|uniref:Uncharacterized protein n=1 Tax=Plakobranchus ocellatus TaxID=259542 RepID=A0AAV4BUG7_9GAST|nr:hypothetical protein PoB_004852400 [Plakobranchus ocellatus]
MELCSKPIETLTQAQAGMAGIAAGGVMTAADETQVCLTPAQCIVDSAIISKDTVMIFHHTHTLDHQCTIYLPLISPLRVIIMTTVTPSIRLKQSEANL